MVTLLTSKEDPDDNDSGSGGDPHLSFLLLRVAGSVLSQDRYERTMKIVEELGREDGVGRRIVFNRDERQSVEKPLRSRPLHFDWCQNI